MGRRDAVANTSLLAVSDMNAIVLICHAAAMVGVVGGRSWPVVCCVRLLCEASRASSIIYAPVSYQVGYWVNRRWDQIPR